MIANRPRDVARRPSEKIDDLSGKKSVTLELRRTLNMMWAPEKKC